MNRFSAIICVVIILFCSFSCIAQLNVTKLDAKNIPVKVKYIGKVVEAARWTDTEGDHIVVLAETGETTSKNSDDGRDASVYAYHYLMNGDSVKLTWKVQDFVKDCPVDIKAKFVKKSFAVTDLDKNDTAEVWMMYQTACRGDVSPSTMKIIMYEGNKKYAIRGQSRVKVSEKDFVGGDYTLDEVFLKAPVVFKNYGQMLWKKNILESSFD